MGAELKHKLISALSVWHFPLLGLIQIASKVGDGYLQPPNPIVARVVMIFTHFALFISMRNKTKLRIQGAPVRIIPAQCSLHRGPSH
jgi:hypothetical protein